MDHQYLHECIKKIINIIKFRSAHIPRYIRSCAALLITIFNIPLIWMKAIATELISPSGYKIFAPAAAVYIFFYNQHMQFYDHNIQRATENYNTFITLVSSGNNTSFVVAMKTLFVRTQRMEVSKEPEFWNLFSWGASEKKYEYSMANWAEAHFEKCTPNSCGDGSYMRIDLRNAYLDGDIFINIDLSKADLSKSTLYRSNIVTADFTNSNLTGTKFNGSRISGAKFKKSIIDCADFTNSVLADWSEGSDKSNFDSVNARGVIFDGADLSSVYSNYPGGIFRHARLPASPV